MPRNIKQNQAIKPSKKLIGILSKKRLAGKVDPATQQEIDKAKIEFNKRKEVER